MSWYQPILFLALLSLCISNGQAQVDPVRNHHADDWVNKPLRGAVVELSWVAGGENYEPYPYLGYVPEAAQFETLRDLGANVVVVYVQQTWTLEAPYEPMEEEIAVLKDTLDAIGDTLPVIIGIRNGPGRNEMMPNFDTDYDETLLDNHIYESASARQAYLTMLRDTVERFADYEQIIAWEPMVEPTPHYHFGSESLRDDPQPVPPMPLAMAWWSDFATEMVAVIRDVAPEMTVILEPINYGSVDGFIGWSAINADNIVYSVHQYDPFEYTHQSVDAESFITYPYDSEIEFDRVDADWIDRYLAPVDRFQQQYDVPILVGEWGIMRWVPGAEDFLRDELAQFERRGWSHTLYAWYDGVWRRGAFELQYGSDPEAEEPLYDNPMMAIILDSWSQNQD